MANLKEIRTRITSVSSTRKITSAMKMVSAAKFKKAQNVLFKYRPFQQNVQQLVQALFVGAQIPSALDYVKPRSTVKNAVLLLLTSNNSMCGAFNANIIKEAKQAYDRLKRRYPKATITFHCLGKKGDEILRREGYATFPLDPEIMDHPTWEASRQIFAKLLQQYRAGRMDRVDIVYNQFKNAASQILKVEPFLPLGNAAKELITNKPADKGLIFRSIIEPNPVLLMSKLFPFFMLNRLHSAILESSASEHGARMTAMHQATENADNLYNELLLDYNKARQSAITSEILEIVTAANAQLGD